VVLKLLDDVDRRGRGEEELLEWWHGEKLQHMMPGSGIAQLAPRRLRCCGLFLDCRCQACYF
jgi:hypothetical protein